MGRDLAKDLEQIYRNHRRALFICALAVCGSAEAAEDAVHEAFARLLKARRRPRDLKPYVFRAVRNAAVDGFRRRGPEAVAMTEAVLDDAANPLGDAQLAEWRERVEEAMRGLGVDECETILLHLYAGLTFREIAEVRQAPPGTVASWYRRGIEKLRRELEAEP